MRMTDEEFVVRQNELLARLPIEFRGVVSYRAYERGHSCGREEVINELIELVDMLEEPIEKYHERVTGEAVQIATGG